MRYATRSVSLHDSITVETNPQIPLTVLNQRTHILIIACGHQVKAGVTQIGERRTKFGRPHPHGIVVVKVEALYMTASCRECLHSHYLVL